MASKYDPTYIYTEYTNKVEPRLNDIESMIAEGKTFFQIAKELSIDNSLLWAMRQDHRFTALRSCFKIKTAYLDNVEMALYRKAVGYYIEEEQAIKVKRQYTDKKGKRATQETVQKVKVMKYVEPDTNAIKFLLINKNADNYHAESQKPIDTTMDAMLDKASQIVVSVKKTANEVADNE